MQIFILYYYVHVGLVKFDTICEHDMNLTQFLRVWIEYIRIWVIFMLTHLTHFINESYSC